VAVAGLLLRIRFALFTYLNPDEALHALLSFGTWRQVRYSWLGVTHPPLLIFVLHGVSLLSRSEFALRLAPLLAGSLFPLVFYAWLRRVAGRMAAMAALFLLTLAPHLVSITAQLRGYGIGLLFLSASLLIFEKAIEENRWRLMIVYSLLLLPCILSDYSMAWSVGAAGVYAVLRLRGSSARLKAIWAAGQVLALGLYGLLFTMQVSRYRGGAVESNAVSGWLVGAFPVPGQMLTFPFTNTLKQFAYLLGSVPLGALAMSGFAIGIFWLLTGRTAIERGKARALAALFVTPFLLGIAGAYAHQFPYGRSHHTLVIGLFGAAGLAILLERLPPRIAIGLLWAALLLTPVWHWRADPDAPAISADRSSKALLSQGLSYMHAAIPPGALIFTEHETLYILAYYEGQSGLPYVPKGQSFSESLLGGRWRVASRDYSYITVDAYRRALADFRRQYGLGNREPVWVIDGGFDVASVPNDPARPFSKAIRIFQAGGW
jgi:hypothetical protein